MSAHQPRVDARRTASQDHPELALDIERVLSASARQAVRATFRFDPEYPLIVSVEFLVEGGPRVLWRIGRDLITQGLYSMSGLGDVQIWPSSLEEGATAWLRLTSGDMAALFELPVPALAEWLDYVHEVVSADHEPAGIDWDLAAANLLRSPGTDSG